MKIFMPLGDATEAMDTFYPYYRLQEEGFDVVVAGPAARLYHTVIHEIPPDSSIPWDITQERPGYFIRATLAFKDAKGADFRLGQFHDDLIAHGSLPVSILTWILLDDPSEIEHATGMKFAK